MCKAPIFLVVQSCVTIQKGKKMSIISAFYGIIIGMYNGREHNPPHFHASYQGYEAVFDMEGNLVEGKMPKKQCRYIEVWADIHKEELAANWELAINKKKLDKIDPLR